ncbi:PREDICTED: PDZ and LIM domain protein Zasp isoform X12 [Bactrocera latifrons]|uniref:PDZ and LIM domain protein Zasp isoform X12 n=1 Tax=Bactrocera latifrons TaxID=174628 RepID=UPI0008DD99B3|nr:PREDICTED: PDZ and LIM domain protein Zasp isoform X12 [Bactrocera latifrons]
MAQPQLLQIKLSRFDAQPWGFRLQGGVDFATPLVVQKVNGGSLAEKAGLIPGDAVLRINDVDVFNLRHKDAQDVVVRSGNNFVLTVQRGGSTWRPHVTPTGNIPQPQQNSPYLQTVTKTSLAHKQQESQHIGCGYNNAARPFANGGDGNVKSIVNKQYNTPVGIYSDESIAETLSAQAEVLAGGVLGVNFKKNEKEYQPDKSEVLKFLREEETDASTPEPPVPANFYWTQSHAIGGNERRTPLSHKHQHLLQEEQPQDESIGTNLQENKIAPSSAQRPSFAQSAKPSSSEPADPRVIIMPVCPALQGPEYKAEMEAAAAALQHDDGPRPFSASGHPACALCGVGIVGVFVRIKDKNLHVECFKCATCGTSLKNQGYYNYNNKLYCDIHAKLAALQNPPPGTDGYVPVPIKPNTKLSANTISSALNAHGFSEIPVANGGSVAPPTAPQVAKPAETLDPPPPVTPDSLSTSQASTAISSTIANSTLLNTTNNINSSNNNKESEQLEGATQSIHGKSTNFSSGMLANPSSALDTSSNKQPFGEYVTLTGSVIRSVVPPGKGVNINYKVNQGYARPFGAAPAVAPKSPVAYPPQRPAINPYATLPRTNVGQQGLTDIKTNAQATAIATANAANAIDTGASQAPHTATAAAATATATTSFPPPNTVDKNKSNAGLDGLTGVGGKGAFGATSAPKRGRGIFNKAVGPGVRVPLCSSCNIQIRGPFITALGRIWCPEHFICVNANCRRPLQDIGFVEEKGDLYCEYCFEKYLAPTCSKCGSKIKGDCLNAIGKQFHPECFTCGHCGKLFGNTPFFLEDGNAYCEADWNELFTTKCFACGFPVEAGDRWVEALNHNYHSQCFNCTYCKQNLEGQSFYNKGGRPFCKNHAR